MGALSSKSKLHCCSKISFAIVVPESVAEESENDEVNEEESEQEDKGGPHERRPFDYDVEEVGQDVPGLGERPEQDIGHCLDDGVQRAHLPHAVHVHRLVVGLACCDLKLSWTVISMKQLKEFNEL